VTSLYGQRRHQQLRSEPDQDSRIANGSSSCLATHAQLRCSSSCSLDMSISGQAVLPLAAISVATTAAASDGGLAPDAGAALLTLAAAEAQVQDEVRRVLTLLRAPYADVYVAQPGVVFSAVVNADGTLPDGTPAHGQDVACLAEWKERFERSGRALRRRAFLPSLPRHLSDRPPDAVHVFINPALEARFEAARTVLTALGRPAKDELLLFHGTPAANFVSCVAPSPYSLRSPGSLPPGSSSAGCTSAGRTASRSRRAVRPGSAST
jgi:hypothetical protein